MWWSLLLALAAVGGDRPKMPSTEAAAFESVVEDFDRFVTETAGLPDAERTAAFRQRFADRAGGYYALRKRDAAKYDAQVLGTLKAYPERRASILGVTRDFSAAYHHSAAKFRRAFPAFRPSVPVYLLHSLGEMDGGTRDYGGGQLLIFGADMIARYHETATIGPFFDHEFFHVYHSNYFRDCPRLWCSLWQEGLAVYVAAKLNPGANDKALLLTAPRPIRPEVEPALTAAMCTLSGKLDSTRDEDVAPFFKGRSSPGATFPPRYGYFLGYVLAEQLGRKRSLDALARMRPEQVRPLLDKALAAYGPCPAAPATAPA